MLYSGLTKFSLFMQQRVLKDKIRKDCTFLSVNTETCTRPQAPQQTATSHHPQGTKAHKVAKNKTAHTLLHVQYTFF